MSENVNETLGIKESEEEKTTTAKVMKEEYGAENTLKFFANCVLVIGIISAFICFIMAFSTRNYYGNPEFNFMGIVYAIACLVPSLLTWSVMRVFANISTTLKKINEKLK